MLKLDQLVACVEAFLQRKECQNWRWGERVDSRASTRVRVESIHLTWDDAPPEARCLCLREAWVLMGGMEHGVHEIQAQVSLSPSSWQPSKLAQVRTAEELTAFLKANLPTGEALRAAQARLADEKAAQERTQKALLEAVTEADVAAFLRTATARLAAALGKGVAVDALRDRIVRLVREATPACGASGF